MDKIFETNSSFLVKERTAGKVQLRFFRRYLLVLKKMSVLEKDYHSMKFGDFSDFS